METLCQLGGDFLQGFSERRYRLAQTWGGDAATICLQASLARRDSKPSEQRRFAMYARAFGAAAAALLVFTTTALAEGDAVAGKKLAMKCASCHSFEAGKIKIGPSLFGVVGRKAGTEPKFAYSKAMKNSNVVWTPDKLDEYLSGPKTLVLGNHMGYDGLSKANSRANIIAYLATLK
jgi:cytochrome c2